MWAGKVKGFQLLLSFSMLPMMADFVVDTRVLCSCVSSCVIVHGAVSQCWHWATLLTKPSPSIAFNSVSPFFSLFYFHEYFLSPPPLISSFSSESSSTPLIKPSPLKKLSIHRKLSVLLFTFMLLFKSNATLKSSSVSKIQNLGSI